MTMGARLTTVEILTVGDELLSGATLDRNSRAIAQRVEPLGLRVSRRTTVGDVHADIRRAVEDALARTGAVIVTGGLGPTPDDVTRSAVARAFDRDLELREDLWEALRQRWAHRGEIPETNRVQALVPAGGEVFANPLGTAAGIAIEDAGSGLCIMLPGPHAEVEAMLEESVVPYLRARVSPDARRPYRRELRTTGIAESAIAARVADRLDDLPLEAAYVPKVDGVDLRLTAWSQDEESIQGPLAEGVRRLRDLLGRHVYAEGRADLARVVGDGLRERGLRVTTAESCTGGLVARRLTDWPGSSDYFWGGVVAYDDAAKRQLLGVSAAALHRHGAVSEEVAREMAEGACQVSGTAASVAVTGIAGPGGGGPEKPVGTVWLAAHLDGVTTPKRHHYPGSRDMIRARAAQGALDLLRRCLWGDGRSDR